MRKLEEAFRVRGDFPRICLLPSGVGDLRYSVSVGSCTDYRVDAESIVEGLCGE